MKNQIVDLVRRTSRARFVHVLVLTRVAIGALLLSGCVSATQYEQAVSAADVEKEGHRRAEVARVEIETKLKQLAAEHAALEKRLAAHEESMSAAEMSVTTTSKERDEQADLVTQLRAELERVGAHLQAYSADKDTLGEEKVALEIELSQTKEEILRLRADLLDAQPALAGADAPLVDESSEKKDAPEVDSEDRAKTDDAKSDDADAAPSEAAPTEAAPTEAASEDESADAASE